MSRRKWSGIAFSHQPRALEHEMAHAMAQYFGDIEKEVMDDLISVILAPNEIMVDEDGSVSYMQHSDCVSKNTTWFPIATLNQFKHHWGASSLIRQDVCKLAKQVVAHRERIAMDWEAVANADANSVEEQQQLEDQHLASIEAFAQFMADLPLQVESGI
jgi:hypothetical protein